MTDEELLQRHRTGDPTAFGLLVDRHEGPLLRYARALLGSRDGAEDVVQECFLRALGGGPARRPIRSVSGWLFQVTRNLCLDRRRKERSMGRRHAEAGARSDAPEAEGSDARLLDEETRGRVREAVAGLSEAQRDVLRLKLWEGLPYREIGERLGMSLSTVSYHAGAALEAVGRRLRSDGILD